MSVEALLEISGDKKTRLTPGEPIREWFLGVVDPISEKEWVEWAEPDDNVMLIGARSGLDVFACIGLNASIHAEILTFLKLQFLGNVQFHNDYHVQIPLTKERFVKEVEVRGKYSFDIERLVQSAIDLIPVAFKPSSILMKDYYLFDGLFPWEKIIGDPSLTQSLSTITADDFRLYDSIVPINNPVMGGRYRVTKKIEDFPEELLRI